MTHVVELVLLDAAVGVAFLVGVMVVAGGLRWDDVRDLILHEAYRSFTFEGDRIAGLAPGVVARTTIRLLSEADDRRLLLIPELQGHRGGLPAFDRLARIDPELERLVVFRAR